MINDFQIKSGMTNPEAISRYLASLCEQLNTSFQYLEQRLDSISKAATEKNPVFDSVTITGDNARLDSTGLLVCNEVKSKFAQIYDSAEVDKITVCNGTEINSQGIKYVPLWTAEGTAGYKTTGDTINNVKDMEKFHLYLMRCCNESGTAEGTTYVLCNRMGQNIRGIASYASNTTYYNVICNLSFSGTTVTVAASKTYYPLNDNYVDRKISRIFGLL